MSFTTELKLSVFSPIGTMEPTPDEPSKFENRTSTV